MKTVFRYFLLLSAVIVPLTVLYKGDDKFPILLGAFLGVTVTFWVAVGVIGRKQKAKSKKQKKCAN
jgi:hypothetical protein